MYSAWYIVTAAVAARGQSCRVRTKQIWEVMSRAQEHDCDSRWELIYVHPPSSYPYIPSDLRLIPSWTNVAPGTLAPNDWSQE